MSVCVYTSVHILRKRDKKKSPMLFSFVSNLLQSRVCRNVILLWLCFLGLVLGFLALSQFSNFLEAGVDGQ